jgi:hypothetical protein
MGVPTVLGKKPIKIRTAVSNGAAIKMFFVTRIGLRPPDGQKSLEEVLLLLIGVLK